MILGTNCVFLKILKERAIRLKDIQQVIDKIQPLPGAVEFLKNLRSRTQVILLSDTFYEFAMPLMAKLGYPALFCNRLSADTQGFVSNYHLRQKDGKKHAVRALQKIGFSVHAAGDSFNDITMLKTAEKGILFQPPDAILKQFPQFPVSKDYQSLSQLLIS